jgi:hypothetical protein
MNRCAPLVARPARWSAFRAAPWAAPFAALVAAIVGCAGSGPVPLSLSPPARIARALGVVADVGCTATLTTKAGAVATTQELDRADDGATFSGFLEAEAGTYTLTLTFTGVVVDGASASGARRFLGRLVSDELRVVTGDTARPTFSRGLDTIGGEGDGGDDDDDGLGLLDELLLGSDPSTPDSDDDGLLDGVDCDPDSVLEPFAIAAGGSVDDCDADGFVRVDPYFAERGDDCGDQDAAVNPGARDDCGTVVDEDCNAATCPVDDRDGPTMAVIAPAAGATVGCGARVEVAIEDPSGVQSAFVTFVDDPFGTNERVLALRDGGGGTWSSAPLVSVAGTGFRPGLHAITVRAVDGAGNARTIDGSFSIDLDAPTITVSGPAVVQGAAATVAFAAASEAPIARFVVFRAPASTAQPSFFDLEQAVVLAELAPEGGGVVVDPADVDARALVYAVVEDVDGRVAGPVVSTFASPRDGRVSRASCDGDFGATIPAVVVEPAPDADRRKTMRDLLADAVGRAQDLDPGCRLTAALGFGAGGDGRVDLGDTGNFIKRWEFQFLQGNGDGIKVRYLTPAFGPQFPETPQVERTSGPPNNEAPLVAPLSSLPDSDAVAARYAALGCGTLTGDDDDLVMVQHAGGVDRWFVSAAGGRTLLLAGTSLDVIAACE